LFQSVPLALALVLLVGTGARAQAPVPAQPQRTLTLTADPAEPPQRVHVLPDRPIVFMFDADIRGGAVTVDTARVRVLAEGARSLLVQLVKGLGPGERVKLEVPFTDGRAPERATFLLVPPAAGEAPDTWLQVTRPAPPEPPPPEPPCPAPAPERAPGPEDFLLLGYLDGTGVGTAAFRVFTDATPSLSFSGGRAYRGSGWVLLDLESSDPEAAPPWLPSQATLVGKAGERLPGRVVTRAQGEPGAEVTRVLVVTEEPPPSAGLVFSLELRGAEGQSLILHKVEIPERKQEGKQ